MKSELPDVDVATRRISKEETDLKQLLSKKNVVDITGLLTAMRRDADKWTLTVDTDEYRLEPQVMTWGGIPGGGGIARGGIHPVKSYSTYRVKGTGYTIIVEYTNTIGRTMKNFQLASNGYTLTLEGAEVAVSQQAAFFKLCIDYTARQLAKHAEEKQSKFDSIIADINAEASRLA